MGDQGIYKSFIHGQIDLIPELELTLGASYVLSGKWEKAGFAVGIAIAAKVSLALCFHFSKKSSLRLFVEPPLVVMSFQAMVTS